jgi:hypothetical protein
MVFKNKIKKIGKFALVFTLFFSLLSHTAIAANLSLNPVSGEKNKGETFTVSVNVSSTDEPMNAAEATITFPTNLLQVVSISKTDSIIDFWAQEPSFSNASGSVKFEGVALTPGFTGSSGKILTINFKGKIEGLADVKITNPSVFANDGFGTSILKSVSGATFKIVSALPQKPETINVKELPKATEGEEVACDPGAIIYSPTHPGQIWRKENTAVFSWDAGTDVVASRIAFDRNSNTEPDVVSKPAIVEKKYENLADGVWYFHLSLQDNSGWSQPEHFKIEIDQTAPTIKLSEIPRSDLTDPKPVLSLNVSDKTSCVKEFNIVVDGEKVDYNKLPDGNLELQTLDPGQHEVLVTVYDHAGNQNEAFVDVTVKSLDEPVIKEYQSQVGNVKDLIVKGETIQNANLSVQITNKKNSFLAKENFQSGSGRFSFTPGMRLKSGIYFMSFKVSDARGASSNWTKPIMVKVGNGVSFDPLALISKIPPEYIMIGLGLIGILLVIFITRALTIRRMKREHGEW